MSSREKQLKIELVRLRKIEQRRIMGLRKKQRELDLRRQIRELKYGRAVSVGKKAIKITGKIARGTGRVLTELGKYNVPRQQPAKKGKKRKPRREETAMDRLNKVLGG